MKKLRNTALTILGLLLILLLNFFFTEEFIPSNQKDVAGVSDEEKSFVTRVVDGDTLIVEREGEEYRVRMIGIDTPETVHPSKAVECFGKEASEKLKELIEEKNVILKNDISQDDTDRYARLIRYVYLDEEDINLRMIQEGYAFEYTYKVPYEKQEEYKEAERNAREKQLGLWNPSICDY